MGLLLFFSLMIGSLSGPKAQQLDAVRAFHYVILTDSLGKDFTFDSSYREVYRSGNKTIHALPYYHSETDLDGKSTEEQRYKYLIYGQDSSFGYEYDPFSKYTRRVRVDSVLQFYQTLANEIDTLFNKNTLELLNSRVNIDSGTTREVYRASAKISPSQSATVYVDYSKTPTLLANTATVKNLEANRKLHVSALSLFATLDCGALTKLRSYHGIATLPPGNINPVVLKLFGEYPAIKESAVVQQWHADLR